MEQRDIRTGILAAGEEYDRGKYDADSLLSDSFLFSSGGFGKLQMRPLIN